MGIQACRYLVIDFTHPCAKWTCLRGNFYAPTVLRSSRFRIAHCSKAARALLHHPGKSSWNGLDSEATAKALLALIVAIRVLGRGVFEEAALQTIADEGKRLIGR